MQTSQTTQETCPEQAMRENHPEQVSKLEKAGIPEDQAKAVVELVGEQVHIAVTSSMSEMAEKYRFADMATKDDLEKMVMEYRLNEVATTDDLEKMVMKYRLNEVATTDDLEKMVMKYRLNEVATTDDLEKMEDKMATTDDLRKLAEKMEDKMATKNDLDGVKAMIRYQSRFVLGAISIASAIIIAILL